MPEPVTIIAAVTAAAAVASTAYTVVATEDAKSRAKKAAKNALALEKEKLAQQFEATQQALENQTIEIEAEVVNEQKKLKAGVVVATLAVGALVLTRGGK